MQHRHCKILGNGLIGFGLATMVGGLILAVINQLGHLALSGQFSEVSVLVVFMGAIIWVAGAHVSGKDKVAERYFLLRYQSNKSADHH